MMIKPNQKMTRSMILGNSGEFTWIFRVYWDPVKCTWIMGVHSLV